MSRFLRTPKGILIAVLVVLVLMAGAAAGVRLVLPGIAGAISGAVAVDLPILRWRKGRWELPDGAILTGLIVAMILSPHEPWYVPTITSAIAVLSKYLLRAGPANIFNPAALALVASYYLFSAEQSWWGALPDLPTAAIVLLLAGGVYITIKVNKFPLVLAFLGTWFLLATGVAYLGDPAGVAELYRAPDLNAALFFAFFMLTDPPTSPPKHRDQVGFGVGTALVGFGVYQFVGAVYFLLAGVLAANVWEGWRRGRARQRRAVTMVS